MSVKKELTVKRRRRVVENASYAAFIRRVIRAYRRRIGEGDIDALPDLVAVGKEVDRATGEAITELRQRYGYSWTDIGSRLGMSRQAAQQRWG